MPVFIFLLLLTSCVKSEVVHVGSPAPPFQLRALSGGKVTLAGLQGKVVLVNFWATWCGPCRAEMPSMEALYGDYDREDFEILAISMDIKAQEADVRTFVREFGFRFPILLDPDLATSQAYQVRVVPTSFLIDAHGALRDQMLGARDWNDPDIRRLMDSVIHEKKREWRTKFLTR